MGADGYLMVTRLRSEKGAFIQSPALAFDTQIETPDCGFYQAQIRTGIVNTLATFYRVEEGASAGTWLSRPIASAPVSSVATIDFVVQREDLQFFDPEIMKAMRFRGIINGATYDLAEYLGLPGMQYDGTYYYGGDTRAIGGGFPGSAYEGALRFSGTFTNAGIGFTNATTATFFTNTSGLNPFDNDILPTFGTTPGTFQHLEPLEINECAEPILGECLGRLDQFVAVLRAHDVDLCQVQGGHSRTGLISAVTLQTANAPATASPADAYNATWIGRTSGAVLNLSSLGLTQLCDTGTQATWATGTPIDIPFGFGTVPVYPKIAWIGGGPFGNPGFLGVNYVIHQDQLNESVPPFTSIGIPGFPTEIVEVFL